MVKGFSFDGAMMFPFRAAHVRSFPWKFALAFAVIGTVLTGVFLYLVRNIFFDFFDAMEALDSSGVDSIEEVFGTMFRLLVPLAPWLVLSGLVSWAVWAMFETASQRRYIRDEDFRLAFGPDEVRMMGVGFVWYAVQWIFSLVPLLIMWPIFTSAIGLENGEMTEDEFLRQVFGRMAIILLSMLVFAPIYIFFATRFAPVFAMTVKEKKIAFGDAWIVSRGRFWPILGAYLIIAVVGGMAAGFAGSIAQLVLMPAMMTSPVMMQDVPDFRHMFTPAMIISILVYMFIRFFMSGLLMHFVEGPAAFAARHDPRGSVDDALRVTDFD